MPRPDTGSQPSSTAKSDAPAAARARSSASRCRASDSVIAAWSTGVPRQTAATMPSGIANSDRHDHRRERQLDRRRQPLGDLRGDRLFVRSDVPRSPRASPVEERAVLLEQRPIEAEPRAQLRDVLRRRRSRRASPAPDRRAPGESARRRASPRRAAPESSAAGAGQGSAARSRIGPGRGLLGQRDVLASRHAKHPCRRCHRTRRHTVAGTGAPDA